MKIVRGRHYCLGLIASCLLFFAVSADAETRDGFWWVRQPENTKIVYVLGSIDRTMLTPSIDPGLKHELVGSPQMIEIVAQLDRIYARPAARTMLVQEAIALGLYQISQSGR